MQIIFIVPSISDSHYRNRIVEFIDKGYTVNVYGFERKNSNKKPNLPYNISILGSIADKNYTQRIKLYIKKFRELGKRHNPQQDVFYLCGLDIAMFFHFFNPGFEYIYEECDLTHTYTRLKGVLEYIDLKIIKSSILTILTSEGFVNYHFNGNKPNNVCLVENKLNPTVLDYKVPPRKQFDKNTISIGFVGAPRLEVLYQHNLKLLRNTRTAYSTVFFIILTIFQKYIVRLILFFRLMTQNMRMYVLQNRIKYTSACILKLP